MGACFSVAEPIAVVLVSELTTEIRKDIVESLTAELKDIIIPHLVVMLNQTEDKLKSGDILIDDQLHSAPAIQSIASEPTGGSVPM